MAITVRLKLVLTMIFQYLTEKSNEILNDLIISWIFDRIQLKVHNIMSVSIKLRLSSLFLDDEDDEELISSSSTARLWKSAFGRRDGEQFLDVCLLKRAYIKAMEEMSDEEDDDETVSSVLDTLIERVNEKIAEDELDELGLAQRLRKRAAASAAKSSNGHQQIKRLRASSSLRHRGSV